MKKSFCSTTPNSVIEPQREYISVIDSETARTIELLSKQLEDARSVNVELTKEVEQLKKQLDQSKSMENDMVRLQEEIVQKEPSCSFWQQEGKGICVSYSSETGVKFVESMRSYLCDKKNIEITLIPCPLLSSNAKFDWEKAEQIISSSQCFFLVISKDSLLQSTTIFTLKCALSYAVPIVVVHDLLSCTFPNPAKLPPIYAKSGIFDEKVVTGISEYMETTCNLLLQKYEEDQALFDVCMCYCDNVSYESIGTLVSEFDQIRLCHLKFPNPFTDFHKKVFDKICNRSKALVVMLTPEISQSMNSLEYLLKFSNEKSLRVHFLYDESNTAALYEILSSYLKRSIESIKLDEDRLEEIMRLYLSSLSIKPSLISPPPPLLAMASSKLIYNKGSLTELKPKDWSSVVYMLGVTRGKWYYEVTLASKGVIQMGWSYPTEFLEKHGKGVGDDSQSFAYDGNRGRKWNESNLQYGQYWNIGDVVGCYIDTDNQEISFSLNGNDMGIAFRDFVLAGAPIYPALSVSHNEECSVNLGDPTKPFRYLNTNLGFQPIMDAPINTRVLTPFIKNFPLPAAKWIIQKEQRFGNIKTMELLTTHAFLSHKRSSAQGIAGRIFQELHTEYNIFLDSEASFNLHNLQLLVKHTGLFIIILSEGILDSYWCLEELRSAIRNKRRVLVLRDYQYHLPRVFPKELKDIELFLSQADTIIYMAEFFSECIKKIRLRLGPVRDVIAPVERYLREENKKMWEMVLDNTFTTDSFATIHYKSVNIGALMDTIRLYYGCYAFANLGSIILQDCKNMTDADVQRIAACVPNLRKLHLQECSMITDEALKHIGAHCPKLERLNISDAKKVSDSGVKELAMHCPNLLSLHMMSNLRITGASLRVIADHCKLFEQILLPENSKITDEEIAYFAKGCTHLKKIYLSENRRITDDGLRHLSENCHELTHLDLTHNQNITDQGLKHLSEGCPKLFGLYLEQSKNITTEGIKYIAKCSGLNELDLNQVAVTGEGLKILEAEVELHRVITQSGIILRKGKQTRMWSLEAFY